MRGNGKLQVCFFACFAERPGPPRIKMGVKLRVDLPYGHGSGNHGNHDHGEATATMIMAKPITLALSPVLGMDTVGSRMMGVLLAFQVTESLLL